jgi:hypothetical protein
MTAKDYLRQYEYATKRIARLEAELEEEALLIDAVRSVSDNDGMPHGSGISKPTEEEAIRLADKRLRLVDAKLEAIRIRQEVFDLVSSIDGVEGEVLFQRYIELRSWEEICVIISYSWAQTHRYHLRALDIVSRLLEIE